MATTWSVDMSKDRLVDGPDGDELERHGQLFDLDATAPGARRLFDAKNDPKVPQRYSPHPFIPFMTLSSRDFRPVTDSPTKVDVTLNYKPFGLFGITDPQPGDEQTPRLTVDSSVQQVDTQFFINDSGAKEQIKLRHTFQNIVFDTDKVRVPRLGDAYRGGVIVESPIYARIPNTHAFFPSEAEPNARNFVLAPDIECEQVGTVSTPLAMEHVFFERIEDRDPHAKARQFDGKTNRSPVFGDAKHFWLCVAIRGSTTDGAQTFTVSYEFARNPDTWNATAVYIDPDAGGPVPGASVENGDLKTGLRITGDIEFEDLNLRI